MSIEEKAAGNPYRQTYIDSIEKLIEARREKARAEQMERLRAILREPETYRQRCREMLGWPLVGEEAKRPNVRATYGGVTEYGAEYWRMQFEIFPDFYYYGILFLHPGEALPLTVAMHGGLGTPELISELHGSSSNYNDMTRRLFSKGLQVFAPQHLLWDVKGYPVFGKKVCDRIDDMRRSADNSLKQVGGSITALELWCLFRALDALAEREEVLGNAFGMVGLSYGGFYTLFASALEERIRAAVSCSFFNDRFDQNWSDWVFKNSGMEFLDAEVALLSYPKDMTIQIGTQDSLFDVEKGKAEFALIEALDRPEVLEKLRLEVFEGIHEFSKNDAPLAHLAEILRKENP